MGAFAIFIGAVQSDWPHKLEPMERLADMAAFASGRNLPAATAMATSGIGRGDSFHLAFGKAP